MGRTVVSCIREVAKTNPDMPALLSKDSLGDFQIITFKNLFVQAEIIACGLASLGVERGNHVSIISNNRKEWIMTDLAVLGIGAIDVPRGSDSTADEIAYILDHSGSGTAFVEDETQLQKVLDHLAKIPKLKTIIVFDKPKEALHSSTVKIISFDDFLELGRTFLAENTSFYTVEVDKGDENDLATIIYTSGTTGAPKGVMLTHRAFLFQMDRIFAHVRIMAGHIVISVLPIWHSFERAVEYIVLNQGAAIAYSKPIGAVMLPDMQKLRPHWMPSAPRIWESVQNAIYRNIKKEKPIKQKLFTFFVWIGKNHAYFSNMLRGCLPEFKRRIRLLQIVVSILPYILLWPLRALGNLLVFSKIKKKLGGRFIAGISGGGALPSYVDAFFQAAGILLLEGYGLTETAPITNVRLQHKPVVSTVGPFLRDIQYKVIDTEGAEVGPGTKGVLWLKSPQLMEGYYKRPEATAEVLKEGWLNTGDIVYSTHNHEVKIIGRAKETIVLLGGENIEPVPIEDKLKESQYIDNVMVVGQDQKYLGALIVPSFEQIDEWAKARSISHMDNEELLQNQEVLEFFHEIIQGLVTPKNGFKNFERIFRFTLLKKEFEVGKELTLSLKLRRNVIEELYKKEINRLFA